MGESRRAIRAGVAHLAGLTRRVPLRLGCFAWEGGPTDPGACTDRACGPAGDPQAAVAKMPTAWTEQERFRTCRRPRTQTAVRAKGRSPRGEVSHPKSAAEPDAQRLRRLLQSPRSGSLARAGSHRLLRLLKSSHHVGVDSDCRFGARDQQPRCVRLPRARLLVLAQRSGLHRGDRHCWIAPRAGTSIAGTPCLLLVQSTRAGDLLQTRFEQSSVEYERGVSVAAWPSAVRSRVGTRSRHPS